MQNKILLANIKDINSLYHDLARKENLWVKKRVEENR